MNNLSPSHERKFLLKKQNSPFSVFKSGGLKSNYIEHVFIASQDILFKFAFTVNWSTPLRKWRCEMGFFASEHPFYGCLSTFLLKLGCIIPLWLLGLDFSCFGN